jgi:hypothetical protein
MLSAGIAFLLLGHIIVPYLLSHSVLSAAVVSVVIVVMVVKHLGILALVFSPWYARLRRRSSHLRP